MLASSTPTPGVRARYMQTFLKGIDQLGEEDARAIRSSLSPGTLAQIASASVLDWLPLSVNLDATRAVSRRLGRERTAAFFRGLILDATNSPLLHSLVRAALRVTISDPGLYLPWLGKGWELVFRDVGHLAARRRGTSGGIFELRGLPTEALAERLWLDSVAMSLGSLAALLDFDCMVTTSHVDPASRTVEYVASWYPRRKASVS